MYATQENSPYFGLRLGSFCFVFSIVNLKISSQSYSMNGLYTRRTIKKHFAAQKLFSVNEMHMDMGILLQGYQQLGSKSAVLAVRREYTAVFPDKALHPDEAESAAPLFF